MREGSAGPGAGCCIDSPNGKTIFTLALAAVNLEKLRLFKELERPEATAASLSAASGAG